MHRPADVGHIAIEVARIATTPGEPAERAAALLEPLHRLLPFDGAWLALRDEQRHGHRSLVSTGWDRRTAAYLDGPVLVDEIEQLGMTAPAPRCGSPTSPHPRASCGPGPSACCPPASAKA